MTPSARTRNSGTRRDTSGVACRKFGVRAGSVRCAGRAGCLPKCLAEQCCRCLSLATPTGRCPFVLARSARPDRVDAGKLIGLISTFTLDIRLAAGHALHPPPTAATWMLGLLSSFLLGQIRLRLMRRVHFFFLLFCISLVRTNFVATFSFFASLAVSIYCSMLLGAL